MKSRKIAKILIAALVLIMLFGTIVPSAYESYDTYTYSIDGEPLASPHAYTPDVETYQSQSMGLLAGNYWCYDAGRVALWLGNSMKPDKIDNEFTSNGLVFELNDEGTAYTVVGYENDYIKALNTLTSVLNAVNETYASTGEGELYEVKLNAAALAGYFTDAATAENYVMLVADAFDNAYTSAVANPDSQGKSVYFTIDNASIYAAYSALLGYQSNDLYLQIPGEYDDIAVVAIAPSAFKSDIKEINAVYSSIKGLILPKSVKTVGENAFAGVNALYALYTELSDTEWGSVSIASGNNALTKAPLYYYSDSVKFGNTALSGANDIVADNDGNLYIADTNNNRIVVLNKRDFKAIGVIKCYTDEFGREQTFNGPTGVFVTDPEKMVDGSSHIFVCDTNNKRIVVFDRNYEYVRTINEPDNALLDENDFTPYAMAVDIYGRIFVISRNCDQGVIVMSNAGDFTGFIGAQKVTKSLIDQIWESFQSADKLAQGAQNLSIPFNNITVDDDGFVYVTINFNSASELKQQLTALTTKAPTYSPVKKLNSMGVEIMKRNGFFDPGGEVITGVDANVKSLSVITDIAMGNEGSWTILDTSRSRTYTYDQNGNLLFAFGDKGDQIGNGVGYVAMTYQVVDGKYNLVLLDNTGSTGFKITVYHPTEYCDTIMEALRNQNNHNYSATIDNWQEVLTNNNNFDLAYIGIGKALYNQGKFDESMEMLSSAYETEYYAKAFTEIRKDIIGKWMLPLLAVAIALIVLVVKFLGWAKKKNKAVSLKVGARSYGEELLYVFHLVFHPFDGFWDLKHEKRGSVRAGATILGITIVAFFYQAIGKGYMFNPRDTYSTVLIQVISVFIPVILWVVGNWCLTTLFDGEGSFKDIFVATCYSLAPLPLFVIVSTVLTNVLTVSEGSIVNLLVTFGYVWVAILLFFGMVVTHDYTTGKNVITTIGTIVAMAVIMFVIILFSSLVMKMATFLIAIITEIGNRLA